MKHPPLNYACVIWDDAHDNNAEIGMDEVGEHHRGARYQSYGWVLRSDASGVTIAGEWSISDNKYRASMYIPRGMVIEEVPLRFARLQTKKRLGKGDPDLDPKEQHDGAHQSKT